MKIFAEYNQTWAPVFHKLAVDARLLVSKAIVLKVLGKRDRAFLANLLEAKLPVEPIEKPESSKPSILFECLCAQCCFSLATLLKTDRVHNSAKIGKQAKIRPS